MAERMYGTTKTPSILSKFLTPGIFTIEYIRQLMEIDEIHFLNSRKKGTMPFKGGHLGIGATQCPLGPTMEIWPLFIIVFEDHDPNPLEHKLVNKESYEAVEVVLRYQVDPTKVLAFFFSFQHHIQKDRSFSLLYLL